MRSHRQEVLLTGQLLSLCFLEVRGHTEKKISVPDWGVFRPHPASAVLLLVEGRSAGRRRGVLSAESLQEETER